MAKISNSDAWENIFEDLKIIDKVTAKKYFDISADEIKKRTGKEARLMTKVDHREHLPKIMQEYDLSILAVANGLYRIAQTDPFININKIPQCAIKTIEQPRDIITINPLNLKSESAALDIAHIANILKDVFQENTDLAIRGRLRGGLDFSLNSVVYNINGVQIEVDGGYEGRNSVNLVEAKIGYRNNINIRQLLYPELFWKNQLKGQRKEVKSFIFYYQDDIFRFIPFKYDGNLISAQHEEEKAFVFERTSTFKLSDIQKNNKLLIDETVPFPQADDFEKIHAILINIEKESCPTKSSIASDFDIVERQHDYYFNVLKWMNLCCVNDGCIYLTDKGKHILVLDIEKRMEEFARIIFSEPICYNELKKIPQNYSDFARYKISATTINRRLTTIRAWIKYFNNFFK
ncbi:MAG: hypothetical protein GX780_01565 [Campylobacteraceae bacterium]|nr:hypothetical protein [Campylobacteraceae bacterium]